MVWTVVILNELVEAEIKSMPVDIQASYVRLADRIEVVGLERIREPHIKHLKGKLWEMRLTGRDGIGRIIYVTAAGKRVFVLHAFIKKTRKTPASVLKIAENRAKEIDQ